MWSKNIANTEGRSSIKPSRVPRRATQKQLSLAGRQAVAHPLSALRKALGGVLGAGIKQDQLGVQAGRHKLVHGDVPPVKLRNTIMPRALGAFGALAYSPWSCAPRGQAGAVEAAGVSAQQIDKRQALVPNKNRYQAHPRLVASIFSLCPLGSSTGCYVPTANATLGEPSFLLTPEFSLGKAFFEPSNQEEYAPSGDH
jgi:hypothetical protein